MGGTTHEYGCQAATTWWSVTYWQYLCSPPRMGVPGRVNVGGPWIESVIDKLLRVDKDGRLVPHLIESWEYSKDGLQLTLNARKGVKFHDGTDFNAQAVKWNLLKAR